jgi:hypothetical protein
MTRPRRPRGGVPGMSQALWLDFVDEPIPDELWGELFFIREEERIEQWRLVRDHIIEAWAREHPGTRPSHWWRYDAPKEPVVTHCASAYEAAQRRRLGGTGSAKHEVLNNAPHFSLGVPTGWLTRWEIDLFSGRVRGMDGEPIGKRRRFKGKAPDPVDPPVFESEAAYLKRHNLLLPSEAKRLTAEDYLPEALAIDVVPDGENPYAPRPGKTGVPV